jgi:hypothetical protein
MRDPEIESVILCRLYEAHFRGEIAANMHTIREGGGWDEKSFWHVANRMAERDQLIRGRTMGGNYRITTAGILHVEHSYLASAELINANKGIRTQIMAALADAYDEGGSLAYVAFSTIAEQNGIATNEIVQNLKPLEDAGYCEAGGGGLLRITHIGYDAVEDWRRRSSIGDEFERIGGLVPQARGRAFQKLLARVVENQE